jgi:preprotein translocase subunit SecY
MAKPSASQVANSLSGGSLSELRKRIVFVLIALVVFRIGTFIPVPGIDISVMREIFDQQRTGILGMFNMFSGGALERMSVFALGVMPYISASIIMQLMTVAVPALEQLKKEGESGRRKITQYTRYGTVVLATFQSVGISVALSGQSGSGGAALVINPVRQ